MKCRKIDVIICSLILLITGAPIVYARQPETIGPIKDTERRHPVIHKLGMEFSPAYLFPTSPFLKGDNKKKKTIRNHYSAHLKYSFQFGSDSRLGQLYPYTSQGIGIACNTFLNSEEIGCPWSLYVFQDSRITKISEHLSLDYEWNFGASFGWKENNRKKNPNNIVVGSKVNAYINLGILFNWTLSSKWNLKAGITGTHYSNGNTSYPNSGMNSVGIRLGSIYTLHPDKKKVLQEYVHPDLAATVFQPYVSYDLTIYGATRKKGLYATDSYNTFVIPGSYGILGLNFNPMYNFNRYFGMGASLDIQYDESANVADYIASDIVDEKHVRFYKRPLNRQLGIGLSLRAEVVMPIFSINLGIGQNFIGKGDDLTRCYQILAMKAHICKNVYLHVGYQLYRFKDPNNLMLGIGYRFNAK